MSKRTIIIVVALLVISIVALVYYLVSRTPGDVEVKGDSTLTAIIALVTSILSLATAIVTYVTALLVLKSRKA